MTNGSLMKVESIAECSLSSILQYFLPPLSDNWSLKPSLVFLRVAVLHRFYCTYHFLCHFFPFSVFPIPNYGFLLIGQPTSTHNMYQQAFRFMMGPGHCPMISKYGPSLSKAVGSVDPSFLVVKQISL